MDLEEDIGAPSLAPSLVTSPDSSTQRPGLQTGDVVTLHSQSGMPLVVVAVEDDDGQSLWALASHRDGGQATALHVVQQGTHYGFCAPSAQHRFLAVRRRGSHRLIFASSQIHSAEQWLLLQPDTLCNPWNSTTLILQNRKMPQVVLHLMAHRVGMLQPAQQHALQLHAEGVHTIQQHGDTSGVVSSTQVQHEIVEHEELEKMRGVLVHEWLQFVNTEKKRRKELELKLLALHGDVEATKQWALLQLQGLRDNMQAEFDVIIDVVNRRNARVMELKQWLHKRLLWGVAVMQRHNEREVKREVILWWREVAREKHQQRHLLETMFVQVQRRRLAAAFASWRNHTTVLVDARQVAHQRAHARRTSLLRDALWGWRDVVEDTQQQRALLMRAVLRIATCRLRWAFSVWRQVTDEEKEDKWRAGVEQEEARRWEDGCVGKMQRVRLRHVLRAWCTAAQHQVWVRQQVGVMQQRAAHRRLVGAFEGWQQVSAHQQHIQQGVQALMRNRMTYMVVGAFDKWRAAVVRRKEQHEAALTSHAATKQQHQLRVVVNAWSAWTMHNRHMRVAAQRVVDKGNRQRLKEAFAAWHEHTQAAHARQTLLTRCMSDWEQSSVRDVFDAWRQGVQVQQRERHLLHVLVERRAHTLMSHALGAWVVHVQHTKALRVARERLERATQRRLLARCFRGWLALRDDAATTRADLRRCLLTKHVAFQAFKRWYWESFEGDVQATVSTLFGVANKAAQSDAPSDASGDVQSISDAELDALLAAAPVDVATLTDAYQHTKHTRLSIHPADGKLGGNLKGGIVDGHQHTSWSIPSTPPGLQATQQDVQPGTTTTTAQPSYVPLSTALLQMHTPPLHLPGLSPPGSGGSPTPAPMGMSMMYNSGVYVGSSGESDGEGSPLRMPLSKMMVAPAVVDRTGVSLLGGPIIKAPAGHSPCPHTASDTCGGHKPSEGM